MVDEALSSHMSAAAVVCAAAEAPEASTALASTIYTKALAAAQRNDIRLLTGIWEKHGGRIITEPLPEGSGYIIHHAVKLLRVKSVIWLLEHGADVNAIDRDGEVRLSFCLICFLLLIDLAFLLEPWCRNQPFMHHSSISFPPTDSPLLVRNHRFLLCPHESAPPTSRRRRG